VAEVGFAEAEGLMQAGLEFERRTGGMAYDAPIHDALMERVRALDARPDLPEARRGTVDDILAYDAWCGRERQRVGAFLDAASAVEEARGDLEAEASMRSMPAERLAGWEALRKQEQRVLDMANALREKIPESELAAHLASFGAGPDGIGERETEIRERIARDEQARRAEERRRAEEERRAEEQRRADDLRSVMDRMQAGLDAAKERRALAGRLRDCLGERETLEAEGGRFIHREAYKGWSAGAGSLLAETGRYLDGAEKLAPSEEPGPGSLRSLSAKLERMLQEDRAELERIRRELTEGKTRQQDRSQDRGFSW